MASKPPSSVKPSPPGQSRFPGDGGSSFRRAVLWSAAAVLLLAGCATKGDLRDLQTDIRRLEARQDSLIVRLERLILATRDSVGAQSDVLFQVRGDMNRELLRIQEQLVTLQELAGQSQRNLAGIRDELEASRRRLSAPPRSAGDTLDTGAEGGPPLGGEVEAPRAGGAEEVYNAAMMQFNRGSFSTARRAFERFLQSYPGHELAPGAHYYLAEILVQEGRYREAVDGFLEIPELFPASSRVPEALYRAGVLYLEELDDPAEARRFLERVVNSYPDSPVASLARERLRELN